MLSNHFTCDTGINYCAFLLHLESTVNFLEIFPAPLITVHAATLYTNTQWTHGRYELQVNSPRNNVQAGANNVNLRACAAAWACSACDVICVCVKYASHHVCV